MMQILFLKAIKEAQTDNQVKGVVLKINTPGGTVGMSQNIYDAIIRLRKAKPVVVFMEDVAASGGYYIASAADRIVAQSGTLTGSIGVIMSTIDAHQLLQNKLLVEPNVIKSGKYKDIGSQLKKMTDAEKQLLQSIVNDTYNQFIRAIINGRIERNDNYSTPSMQLDMETLTKYADGRIFTGSQAKTFGFIDSNGDLEYATEFAKVMASEKFGVKVKSLNVQNYPDKKISISIVLFLKCLTQIKRQVPCWTV
ncbi:MAG: signal peptide peptidase SppA [Candidatus Melainabacteria bacterium]|nr:MAG: signal peptide peptidase SppA [Candidatus Melainabacteria bacterium]